MKEKNHDVKTRKNIFGKMAFEQIATTEVLLIFLAGRASLADVRVNPQHSVGSDASDTFNLSVGVSGVTNLASDQFTLNGS